MPSYFSSSIDHPSPPKTAHTLFSNSSPYMRLHPYYMIVDLFPFPPFTPLVLETTNVAFASEPNVEVITT
jgi:hypothetical protein